MIEFGLPSADDELTTLKILDDLELSLGTEYDFFFDQSYEMAVNSSKCLWQERFNQKLAVFRGKCDQYLIDSWKNADALLPRNKYGVKQDKERFGDALRKRIQKCKAL